MHGVDCFPHSYHVDDRSYADDLSKMYDFATGHLGFYTRSHLTACHVMSYTLFK
jgi:hypothetical protein